MKENRTLMIINQSENIGSLQPLDKISVSAAFSSKKPSEKQILST